MLFCLRTSLRNQVSVRCPDNSAQDNSARTIRRGQFGADNSALDNSARQFVADNSAQNIILILKKIPLSFTNIFVNSVFISAKFSHQSSFHFRNTFFINLVSISAIFFINPASVSAVYFHQSRSISSSIPLPFQQYFFHQ